MNYMHKNMNAILYECGYSNDNSIFLVLGSDKFFFTDGRYTFDAKEKLGEDIELNIVPRNIYTSVVEFILSKGIKSLTIDPFEFNINEYIKLKDTSMTILFSEHMSFHKRIIKSNSELKILKDAATIGANAFKAFSDFLQSSEAIGMSDYDLHYKAKELLSNKGELDLSFDPIVAINKESSKPHAHTCGHVLNRGDILLFDAGVVYKNYCSDRTRTAEVTNSIDYSDIKSKFSDSLRQKVYDTVLKAHDETIAKAKIGMTGREIDAIGRDIITKAGFGKEFAHGTGHGVGIDVHEFPMINQSGDTIIEENMVFTIEPGIYLENNFGVRIEDNVVAKSDGVEIL